MISRTDDVVDILAWVAERVRAVYGRKRGAIGAAWDVANGPASALHTYSRVMIAARNHGAAEGAEL